MKNFVVPFELQGKRIDVALYQIMKAYSRSFVQKLIRKKLVKINGKIAKKGNNLHANDVVSVLSPKLTTSKFVAKNIPLEIIYEDKDLLVINKPADILTHPSAHERDYTIVNALLYHCGNRLSGIGGEKRPGIVHRLDKDTSGVLIVAKHDESHKDLAKQFQKRKVEKYYLTLVNGVMNSHEGSIEAPLLKKKIRDQHRVIISTHRDAKLALTHFTVIKTFLNSYSLLEVRIVTGRMHQIRVHFSAIHHPVVGDPLYGNKNTNDLFRSFGLQRQFLHSYRIKLKHPRTKQFVEYLAPLPSDLNSVLNMLNKNDVSILKSKGQE